LLYFGAYIVVIYTSFIIDAYSDITRPRQHRSELKCPHNTQCDIAIPAN